MIPQAPTPSWIEANIRAGVRIILKRALRIQGVPFHGSEDTPDLLHMAAVSNAPLAMVCDEWAGIAQRSETMTGMERYLFKRQAHRALEVLRMENERR